MKAFFLIIIVNKRIHLFSDMPWLVVCLAMIGKLAITSSYGAIYVFTAEQFPTVIRNVGLGASSTFARIGGVIAPYVNHLVCYHVLFSISRSIEIFKANISMSDYHTLR